MVFYVADCIGLFMELGKDRVENGKHTVPQRDTKDNTNL